MYGRLTYEEIPRLISQWWKVVVASVKQSCLNEGFSWVFGVCGLLLGFVGSVHPWWELSGARYIYLGT